MSAAALPVVGTFQAAAAVSQENFRYYEGRVGQIANQPADALLDSADVVITAGYDVIEYWPTHWNKGKDRSIVHIDVKPAKIEIDYSPTVELIESTLSALSSLLHRWSS